MSAINLANVDGDILPPPESNVTSPFTLLGVEGNVQSFRLVMSAEGSWTQVAIDA